MTITRTISPTELGPLVALFREAFGWSQETLAELSGLTVRTIQRVEAGQPSSLDTRRALARAFQYDDIDHFSRVAELPTPEEIAAQHEAFERTYVVIDAEMMDGQALLLSMSAVAAFGAFCPNDLMRIAGEARAHFAAITDFVSDCLDIVGDVPKTDLPTWGSELDELAAPLAAMGLGMCVGQRNVVVAQQEAKADVTALACTVTYLTIAAKAGPARRKIAVQRNH